MTRIRVAGADRLVAKLDAAVNIDVDAALIECAHIIEDTAKRLAPDDSGQLRRSITHEPPEDDSISVGTNVVYAPYVEFGTGIYSTEGGDGSGMYWVFVKGSHSDGPTSHKRYTLEQAKQIVAIMRSKGLDAWYTCGQKPQPFMHPALFNNQAAFTQIFDNHIKEAMND